MITAKVDTHAVTRMLTDLQRKQIPFTTMTGLNAIAFQVQRAERDAFANIFAHPRPFTQRSVLVTKASKSKLVATVFVRPEVASYLLPYETGGTHVVPGQSLLVPVDAKLDQYGQFTQSQLRRLNALANDPQSGVFFGVVHGVRGYWVRAKPARKARRAKGVAASPIAPPKLTLLARIEQPGPVTEHLEFVSRGTVLASKAAPAAFEAALQVALATARP